METATPSAAPTTTTTDKNGMATSTTPITPENVACRPQMLQIINEAKVFSPHLTRYLQDEWHLADSGIGYHLVAVFGSQSTGKSTLLNRLFGTQFDVMDNARRQQTTRGLWLSKARDQPILVMDVEGTDGRERGEDQEFERRSALFSMTVAEVIIVNIWENMVGLYNGANMGLLKMVFEANLQLFHNAQPPSSSSSPSSSLLGGNKSPKRPPPPPSTKTLLAFVIRDFIGSTSIEALQQVLMESLEKVWSEAAKPAGQESARMRDFFDFAFFALPHKILQPERFESEAVLVRERFVEAKHKDYVFREKYHRQIPADGLPRYLTAIWDKIISNKDLDLPSQQQLLAQFRCDEISNTLSSKFSLRLAEYEHTLASGKVVDDFKRLATIRDTLLEEFHQKVHRYHPEVVQRKLDELTEKMNASLHVLFVGQLRNLRKQAILDFKAVVADILKGDANRFATRLIEGQKEAERFFREHANNAVLTKTNWHVAEDIRAFNEELFELASKIRTEEMDKLVKKFTKSSQHAITEGIMQLFADTPKDLWSQALRLYHKTAVKFESTFSEKAAGFAASPAEIGEYTENLRSEIWDGLRAKLREELSDQLLQTRLRNRFEEKFRYDDEGLPRLWQQNENFEPQFVAARDTAEDLITLFAHWPIPADEQDPLILHDPDFDEQSSAITLLPPSKQRDLKDRMKRDADAIFMEVKRGAISSFSEIPKGMWLLLLLFGFNEIYAFLSYVLTNPFTLVVLMVLAAAVMFLFQSGLLVPTLKVAMRSLGPAFQVAVASVMPLVDTFRVAMAETLKQASEKLDNGQPSTVATSSSSSSSAGPATPRADRSVAGTPMKRKFN